MNGARDTVLELQVHLGDSVLGEDRGIGDVTCIMSVSIFYSSSCRCGAAQGIVGHTDGGRLDHVADGESLDCLVLGCASRAVGAADGLDVAAALLVTTVGRALLDHVCG